MTDAPRESRFGRKALVRLLTVYAAMVLTVCGASAVKRWVLGPDAGAEDRRLGRPPPGEFRIFLGPIEAGRKLDGGAKVTRVGPLRSGGLQIDVRPDPGTPVALEVRRKAPSAPRPLAETPSLAIYLATPTPAGSETPPTTVRLAEALAAALAEREAEAPIPSALTALEPR